MMFIARFAGIGIIILAVLAFLLAKVPLFTTVLGLFGTVGAGIAANISWTAANLEIVLPAGLFLLTFGPAPQQLLFATILSVVAGLLLWGVFGL